MVRASEVTLNLVLCGYKIAGTIDGESVQFVGAKMINVASSGQIWEEFSLQMAIDAKMGAFVPMRINSIKLTWYRPFCDETSF